MSQTGHVNAERNPQILLMGEIYQRGIVVQVWLGEVDGMTSQDLEMVECRQDNGRLIGAAKNRATGSLELVVYCAYNSE